MLTTRLAAPGTRVAFITLALAACGDSTGSPPLPVAAQLAFITEPTDAAAGEAIAPAIQVEIRDVSGSRVPGALIAVTLSLAAHPGGAVLTGTRTRDAVNGVATFADLSLDRAATGYTLAAEAAGLAGATSAAFSVSAGPAARLSFLTQPPATAEGQVPFGPIVVGIEDALGNPVSGAPVSVALAEHASGAVLSGTLTVSSAAGEASFGDLSVALPGAGFVLRASSGAAPVVVSEAFDVRITFAQVSAGSGHTCGVTVAGFAYCWGRNSDPVFGGGLLGDGTKTDRHTPTPVLGRLRFSHVSAGAYHTCGVTTDHEAYCWGGNSSGWLGDGTVTERLTPTAVAGGLSFAQVSAGSFHTCGVTTDNVAYCWGHNNTGKLGDGTTSNRATPEPVAGGLSFQQVSGGNGHTCGVTTGNAAYCWGQNGDGQLGDGTTTQRENPVAVAGGLSFQQVSVGIVHTCGVTTDQAAYCWGRNSDGALGDGTTEPRLTPTSVDGPSFARVHAGGSYTCGITPDGAAYCWGRNDGGRLGDGTTEHRHAPTPVTGGLAFAHAGGVGSHTCGVTTGNIAYCWGDNSVGQLGDGTTDPRLMPVQVVH